MKKRKKSSVLAIMLAMVLMLTPLFSFADEASSVASSQPATTNEISVILDKNQTVIVEGRTLLGIRAFSEAVDLPISWDQADKLVIIDQGDTQVVIKIGDNAIYRLTGDATEKIAIDQPARVINGKTVIPVAAAAKALGLNTAYDPVTKQVAIFAETNPLAMGGGNPSDLPEPTQPITNDLSAINSKSIKKVIIDGTEVKFQYINNKIQVSIPELKRSLRDWEVIGGKDYQGRLIFQSAGVLPLNEGITLNEYSPGITMYIWADNGKMWISTEYMGQIDPFVKSNGQYLVPLSLLVKMFKLDFEVSGGTLTINTFDRGTINLWPTVEKLKVFYDSPDKILGEPRPKKYHETSPWWNYVPRPSY